MRWRWKIDSGFLSGDPDWSREGMARKIDEAADRLPGCGCPGRPRDRAGEDPHLGKGLFEEAFFVSEGKYPRDLWKSPYLWGIIKNA